MTCSCSRVAQPVQLNISRLCQTLIPFVISKALFQRPFELDLLFGQDAPRSGLMVWNRVFGQCGVGDGLPE